MIKWSATRINVANYCRMRYYLNYVDPDKPKPLRLSAYVRGSLLHGLIENFWDKMGTPEEVSKKSSKKKYCDAESFSSYAQGKWQGIIFADDSVKEKYNAYFSQGNSDEAEKIKSHLIYWKNSQEKWTIKSGLKRECIPLFSYLLNEGRPLFSELKFDFVLNNRRFTGRLDEVRKRDGKVIIRDYKSGNPWVGDEKKYFDPQLTMYNVSLCSLCYDDRAFAEKLGLESSLVDKFMGHPMYINPDFQVEFFMIDALGIDPSNPKIHDIPPVIVSSDRKDAHFFEVIKMIEGIEESIRTKNIYPERGRKCDSCDLKSPCRDKLNDVRAGTLVDKRGQQYFNFATPLFIQKEEKPAFNQRKFRFRYK